MWTCSNHARQLLRVCTQKAYYNCHIKEPSKVNAPGQKNTIKDHVKGDMIGSTLEKFGRMLWWKCVHMGTILVGDVFLDIGFQGSFSPKHLVICICSHVMKWVSVKSVCRGSGFDGSCLVVRKSGSLWRCRVDRPCHLSWIDRNGKN